MDRWPYPVPSLSMPEILDAVQDEDWQKFRLTLKGLSTRDKLTCLEIRLFLHRIMTLPQEEIRKNEIRVANYINALKRGGQLNGNLEIVS